MITESTSTHRYDPQLDAPDEAPTSGNGGRLRDEHARTRERVEVLSKKIDFVASELVAEMRASEMRMIARLGRPWWERYAIVAACAAVVWMAFRNGG